MPELAEVEFYRRKWDPGLGEKILEVALHPDAKVFRGCDTRSLVDALGGATLLESQAAAKQMLFRLSGQAWLGIHLGMTGRLSVQSAAHRPERQDHLLLRQRHGSLLFSDPRMFGRVRLHVGPTPPGWWTSLAPAILSPGFTLQAVSAFLRKRPKTPVKSALLMQEQFPGIGNWMADEILWRAGIHPKQPAGTLSPADISILHRECRHICREALRIIGHGGPELRDPPASWLFPHRWEAGGSCPKTGAALVREKIRGRTTCWSPALQRLKV